MLNKNRENREEIKLFYIKIMLRKTKLLVPLVQETARKSVEGVS